MRCNTEKKPRLYSKVVNMSRDGKTDKPRQTTNLLVVDESGIRTKVNISHANNVQIGSGNVMVIQSRKHPEPMGKAKSRQEPSITGCSDTITDEDIESMEQNLGRHWKPVARKLGFEDGEIDIISHDFRESLREQIHQMLRQWKQRHAANATVGSLAKAIFSVNECDGVLKHLELNHPGTAAKRS